MLEYNHILVVVDFRQTDHFALTRAMKLASKFNSKVTVASTVYESFMDFIPSSSAIDRQLIKEESLKLNDIELQSLVSKLDTEGLEINYQSIWNSSIHAGLCDFINENDFDLVAKTVRSHNALEKLLFTPTDWHLLRDTSTDILFVKEGKWPSQTGILGAINIDGDQAHHDLNRKIIKTTVALAETCGSVANILNVFPWPMIKLDKFNHIFDGKDLFLEIKKEHTVAVNEFVQSVAPISGKIVVAEGLEPQETLPEMVKSSHSDLLVMGSVGRKGIKAAMIGNTAEKILDEIKCEVLVLK